MALVVTGGAGFIGSALVRHLLTHTDDVVVTVDKLTYAGNLESLGPLLDHPRHRFERLDILDGTGLQRILSQWSPRGIFHLAAESHVDRSIDGPLEFVRTNVLGTASLLEAARSHWSALPAESRESFRFVHVSTDEVYGSLGASGLFSEESPYRPSSPYAASKASSDHLVRSWGRTYGLPVMVTNCSNNYGPYQFPEKFIPHLVLCGLKGQPMPIYGTGENVRDWIHVEDHARALVAVLERGTVGQTYNIGGQSERRNVDVAAQIAEALDGWAPSGAPHRDRLQLVRDRPGHDHRYAIDSSKIQRALEWRPLVSFEAGLRSTVEWYVNNPTWWARVLSGEYRLGRAGLGGVYEQT